MLLSLRVRELLVSPVENRDCPSAGVLTASTIGIVSNVESVSDFSIEIFSMIFMILLVSTKYQNYRRWFEAHY